MLKKIATNTISQLLSKFLTAIISVFLIKVLTNYLSVDEYGLYNKIYSYLGIFAFLADLGLYTITIREISAGKEDASKIVGNVMTLRLLLGIVIVFLSVLIAYFLPGYNSEVAIIAIFITSIFTLFGLMNSSILAVMQANMKIEFSLISRVLGKVLNFVLILIGVFVLFREKQANFLFSFNFIMFAGLAGIVLNTYLNYNYAKKIVDIRLGFDWDYIKYIFKISIPYGLALFLSVVYFKIDIVLLSIIEPQAKADTSIALYSVPMKIVEVLMVLSGFFLNSVLPIMSKAFAEKHIENIGKILGNSYKTLLAFGVSLLVIGSVLKEDIIKLVASPCYIDHSKFTYTSSDVFTITLFILLFYFISQLFIYLLIASEHQKRLLYINAFIAIFNLIGNILIIPYFSFIGSAYITIASQIILLLSLIFYSRDIFKFNFPKLYTLRVLLFGFFLYTFGNFLVNRFSLGTYLDLIFYGGFLSILFGVFFYFEFSKDIKKSLIL